MNPQDIQIVLQGLWDERLKQMADPKHVYMSPRIAARGNFKDGDEFKGAKIHLDEMCGDVIYMTQEEIGDF